jgi:large subunit ribosomal protein L24
LAQRRFLLDEFSPSFNAAAGRGDRVGIKLLADGKKVRIFRSTGEEIKA